MSRRVSHFRPEYAIEAALLGLFMVAACGLTVLLEHPASALRVAVPEPGLRRVLMGLGMGATAVALIYSPWGRRSGAHMNPATTLTFARLGRIGPADGAAYVAAQFLGAAAGVLLASLALGELLADRATNYAATRPGPRGVAVAFGAELVIAFVLMSVILTVSNHPRRARFTGLCAGLLVALYISIEAPLSGMSMNPARTLGSALFAMDWEAVWIYFVAPPLGMLAAAEVYLRRRGADAVFCAKLCHTEPCLFCEWRARAGGEPIPSGRHFIRRRHPTIKEKDRMRRRTWIIGLVVLGAIGWYLFRPELLFVKTTVNERLPGEAVAQAPATSGVVLSGEFRSYAHETVGTAAVHQLGDRRVLRLTGFSTSNGPDVRVYLVAAHDATDDETVTRAGFVELGKLKGTQGDQNYDIPAGLDLEKYRAVTIWCRRFSVNFGTAPLTPAFVQEARAQGASRATRFTVRVENVSRGEALKLSTGGTAPFVAAPVFWALHTTAAGPIFTGGQPRPENGLEQLAETGNPEGLLKYVSALSGVTGVGANARPVGATADGPLTPGQAYEFQVSAAPGQSLSLAWMFGQSNDLFYSNDRPIALFDGGKPVSGDLTAQVSLWDAGTEVNEEPGLGSNQAPRQKSPDAGITERRSVGQVRDRYDYPRLADVLRLTVTPAASAVSSK